VLVSCWDDYNEDIIIIVDDDDDDDDDDDYIGKVLHRCENVEYYIISFVYISHIFICSSLYHLSLISYITPSLIHKNRSNSVLIIIV